MQLTIPFTYDAEKYSFHVEKEISIRSTGKYVYSGTFSPEAPGNLSPGTRYCLKKYDVTDHMLHERTPQNREYMDLISYEGKHLRQILLKDDNTRALLSDSGINHPVTCMIIEPLYQKIQPAAHTFDEKLEIMLQTIAGLEELNTADNGNIVAHRDLKLGNLMLERDGTSFCVKIIDFASAKIAETPSDGDGTEVNAMSLSNTAPEYILGIKPSAEADVFALGMVLAELFGLFHGESGETVNPMRHWFESIPRDSVKKTYGAVWQKYSGIAEEPSWLEQELTGKLTLSEAEFPGELLSVFRRCIACDPDKRISLSELKKVLSDLRSRLFYVMMLDLTELDRSCTKYLEAMKEYSVSESADIRHMVYVYHDVDKADVNTLTNWKEVCSGIGKLNQQLKAHDVTEGLRNEKFSSYPKTSCSGITASLYGMIREREMHPENFRYFSGKIHVFTSADVEAGKTMTVNGKTIRHYTEMLGAQSCRIVYWNTKTGSTKARHSEEHRPFEKGKPFGKKPFSPASAAVSGKNTEGSVKNVPKGFVPGDRLTDKRRPQTNDLFFRDANGSIHYVVIHKE